MRVLLVNPFGSNWVEGRLDRSLLMVRLAPMGLLSMAAYIEQRGCTASVVSTRLPAALGGAAEVLARVRSFRPGIVGFTATTSGFLDACRIAGAIKAEAPDIRTVFGGVHVSALRERLLADYPVIDVLVTGEGEQALAELAGGRPLAEIQGILYRGAGGIRATEPRTQLCTLDDLPFPAYSALEGFPQKYEAPLFNYPKAPTATIISSRGCPYQCTYCDRSVFGRSFRYNSAPYLYEHMRFLRKDFGVRHVFFYDDLFTFQRARIEELCGLLRERPLGMTFNCAVRVGHIDDELLRALKSAGCWMVSLGIESGDRELLARHKSNIDPGEMKKGVRQVQASGIRVKGLFMMGLPGETEQTIRRTSDFIAELGLDDMNMTKFTPFPGSPLYRAIGDEGTFEERWELMNCLNFVFIPKGIPSRERLEELYKQTMKRFYTSRDWMRKFPRLMFKSPHSAFRFFKHLPTYLRIKADFEPEGKI